MADVGLAFLGLIGFTSAGVQIFLAVSGHSELPFLAAMVFSAVGVLASLMVVFLRASARQLGLHSVPWRWCLAGVALVIPFMGVTWGWITLVEYLAGGAEEQGIVQAVREPEDTMSQMAALIYAIGIAPIAEEILFRGFLLTGIERASNTAIAIALSAIAFGLMHIADPITVVPLTLMGACLGWLRVRSGSLWPAWAMHIGNNASALGLTMLAES